MNTQTGLIANRIEGLVGGLIDDRPVDGVFRVSPEVFRDPEIFELEMQHIFEATWVFVGLESQLPRPHDYVTTQMGRHPVVLMRDGSGTINCFLNTCRHRGTVLCPFKSGTQKIHSCRYHGWTYDSSGKNILITGKDAGQYPAAFGAENHDLLRVARLAAYRGFLFASLREDVPELKEHLSDVRTFIDLLVDQSPVGAVEFVPGTITYTFDANWKLQFENGLDFYHFPFTHSSYIDLLQARAKAAAPSDGYTSETEPEGQGSFNFAHGHAVNWSIRKESQYGRPLGIPAVLAEARGRVGDERLKWMLRQRNLTIYPNTQIIDITSAQLRTWVPLAADKTEMTSHCLAPVGEGAEARRMRIRNYEDFFNPTGLASSDDNVMYEFCQSGYDATQASFRQGYSRGLGTVSKGKPSRHAEELGIHPVECSYGPLALGAETNFYAGYREWLRLLRRGIEREAAQG